MNAKMLRSPVVLMIYKRPYTTQRVFEAIRQAQPKKLFVIADGPHPDRPEEVALCRAARTIVEQVDWDCRIELNYSNENLGCKRRISSGLDWAFSFLEEAIILEDDCVPHPSFFRYCDELLEYYRYDERVGLISGNNFLFGRERTPYSYYFSRYNFIWGWAGWRRTWKNYDVGMKLWPEIRDNGFLEDILNEPKLIRHWTKIFDAVYSGYIDTWDFQLTFLCWIENKLTIQPMCNLVSNIGSGKDASSTQTENNIMNMLANPMKFPLIHPPYVIRDNQADDYALRKILRETNTSIYTKLVKKLCILFYSSYLGKSAE